MSVGRAELERLLAESGLPNAWQQFLVFVAAGESGFHSTALNDTPGEAKASKRGYDRNAGRLAACGNPPSWYAVGSGGWFGMLYAYAPFNLPDEYRCMNPADIVHDPVLSIAAAVSFARYLKGVSNSDTVVSMRAGWGWPAKANDATRLAGRRPVYVKRATKLGWPPSYVDSVLPAVGIDAAGVIANLKGTA